MLKPLLCDECEFEHFVIFSKVENEILAKKCRKRKTRSLFDLVKGNFSNTCRCRWSHKNWPTGSRQGPQEMGENEERNGKEKRKNMRSAASQQFSAS
jgi:hypothetical protein